VSGLAASVRAPPQQKRKATADLTMPLLGAYLPSSPEQRLFLILRVIALSHAMDPFPCCPIHSVLLSTEMWVLEDFFLCAVAFNAMVLLPGLTSF
jgi:hypothetical protein